MKPKYFSQILDEAAREAMPADIDLTSKIVMRIQKEKNPLMHPRLKAFAAVSLGLIVLVLILINVPAVKAAILRWTGYAPGFGLVGGGQVRTLAEPVSVTREGITVMVKQLMTDASRTLIFYSVEGRPAQAGDIREPGNGCLEPALLTWEGGELQITEPQSVYHNATGYQLKSTYPAIPDDVNELTLNMPCVLLAKPGEAPEDWKLPLRLVPAPPDAVFPVIDVPTPTAEVLVTPGAASEVPSATNVEGVSLVMDRAVQLQDGWLLYVTIHWEDSGLGSVEIPDLASLYLRDANGQDVTYEVDYDATNELQAADIGGRTAFALRTTSQPAAGPLTLVLNSLYASMAAQGSFVFDPGANPVPGQTWELDQSLDLGNGHTIRVVRAEYNLTDGTQAMLGFDIESDTGVTYATLYDKAHPNTGMGGGGGGYTPGAFRSDLYFLEPLPAGPITVDVIGISLNLPGHWESSWTPPAP